MKIVDCAFCGTSQHVTPIRSEVWNLLVEIYVVGKNDINSEDTICKNCMESSIKVATALGLQRSMSFHFRNRIKPVANGYSEGDPKQKDDVVSSSNKDNQVAVDECTSSVEATSTGLGGTHVVHGQHPSSTIVNPDKTLAAVLSSQSAKLLPRCNVCHAQYANPSTLERHMRTHDPANVNRQPYKCDVCGMGYVRESALRVHQHYCAKSKPPTVVQTAQPVTAVQTAAKSPQSVQPAGAKQSSSKPDPALKGIQTAVLESTKKDKLAKVNATQGTSSRPIRKVSKKNSHTDSSDSDWCNDSLSLSTESGNEDCSDESESQKRGTRNYQCDECLIVFKDRFSFSKHSACHKNPQNKKYVCSWCHAGFNGASALSQHERRCGKKDQSTTTLSLDVIEVGEPTAKEVKAQTSGHKKGSMTTLTLKDFEMEDTPSQENQLSAVTDSLDTVVTCDESTVTSTLLTVKKEPTEILIQDIVFPVPEDADPGDEPKTTMKNDLPYKVPVEQMAVCEAIDFLCREQTKSESTTLVYDNVNQCHLCFISFKNKGHLVDHLKQHSQSELKPYHCRACKIGYSNLYLVNIHESKCGLLRRNLGYSLQKHISLSKSDNNIKPQNDQNSKKKRALDVCSYCLIKFSSAAKVKAHQRTVHAENPKRNFQCDGCKAGFQILLHLKRHQNKCGKLTDQQSSDKSSIKYKCLSCQTVSETKSDFLLHIADHEVTNLKRCRLCRVVFNSVQEASAHMVAKHEEYLTTGVEHIKSPKSKVGTPVASQKPSKTDCSADRATPRRGGLVGTVCPVCKRSFASNSIMRQHYDIHDTLYPNACLICGVGYDRPSKVHEHKVRTHMSTGRTTDQQCEKCRGFFPPKALFVHRDLCLRVEGDDTKQCFFCTQTFVSNIALRAHMAVHNTKCSFCTAKFDSSIKRAKHMKRCRSNPRSRQSRAKPGALVKQNSKASSEEKLITLKSTDTTPKVKVHPTNFTRRRYGCRHCCAAFLNAHHRARHEVLHKNGRFRCDFCIGKFYSPKSRTIHMRRLHSQDIKTADSTEVSPRLRFIENGESSTLLSTDVSSKSRKRAWVQGSGDESECNSVGSRSSKRKKDTEPLSTLEFTNLSDPDSSLMPSQSDRYSALEKDLLFEVVDELGPLVQTDVHNYWCSICSKIVASDKSRQHIEMNCKDELVEVKPTVPNLGEATVTGHASPAVPKSPRPLTLLKCTMCSKSFKLQVSLNHHMVRMHPKNQSSDQPHSKLPSSADQSEPPIEIKPSVNGVADELGLSTDVLARSESEIQANGKLEKDEIYDMKALQEQTSDPL